MTFQAIRTKYHGPTNFKGSRITAACEAGKVTIPYPHELSGEACHRKAAETLCDKLGWNKSMVSGGFGDGTYAFVFTDYPAK
jgi:hypothetical protein